jgi:hypothetical protein
MIGNAAPSVGDESIDIARSPGAICKNIAVSAFLSGEPPICGESADASPSRMRKKSIDRRFAAIHRPEHVRKPLI